MAVIGIAAVDRNGAIGRGGRLPWRYPADMRFFREQTTGHACVMGYRTWLTIGKPLKERLNVVLSRRGRVEPRPSLVTLRDPAEVLSLRDYLRCDLYVIGGAQIFRAFLGEIDRWVVTEVPLAVEGADAFMPAGFLEGFRQYDSRLLETDGGGELVVKFYERA